MTTVELSHSLKELRLYAISSKYNEVATQCEVEKLSHIEYLKSLVSLELEHKYHKKIKRLLKGSKIPRNKSIKDFNIERIPELNYNTINDLVRGDFIDRAENLLIFGNPGTGKSHISIALTQEWCSAGRKVLFISAAELIQELVKAKHNICWNEQLQKLNKYDVIVIDDISYIPCDRKEADLLFILLASRYEAKSVVITSNLPFADWNSIFMDEMTTAAAIDRLVHHSIILTLNTDSYRKEIAKKRKKTNEEAVMKA